MFLFCQLCCRWKTNSEKKSWRVILFFVWLLFSSKGWSKPNRPASCFLHSKKRVKSFFFGFTTKALSFKGLCQNRQSVLFFFGKRKKTGIVFFFFCETKFDNICHHYTVTCFEQQFFFVDERNLFPFKTKTFSPLLLGKVEVSVFWQQASPEFTSSCYWQNKAMVVWSQHWVYCTTKTLKNKSNKFLVKLGFLTKTQLKTCLYRNSKTVFWKNCEKMWNDLQIIWLTVKWFKVTWSRSVH